MKVGNTIGGMTVTDVKLINKLNLIQFLKEVDSYLQKGYQIDVTSGRQIGLVLQAYVYKTEDTSNVDVGSVGDQIPTESVELAPEESVVPESTVQQEQVNVEAVVEGTSVPEVAEQPKENVAVEPVEEVVEEEAPVAPKKTTTRSKKTAQ